MGVISRGMSNTHLTIETSKSSTVTVTVTTKPTPDTVEKTTTESTVPSKQLLKG